MTQHQAASGVPEGQKGKLGRDCAGPEGWAPEDGEP